MTSPQASPNLANNPYGSLLDAYVAAPSPTGLPLQFYGNDGAAPTLGPPWSMQGHDAQRTGRGSVSGPVTATVKWTYQFTSGAFHNTLQDQASPVVGPDGTIYQPTNDAFYAINPNGTLKWSLSLPGLTMRNAPALSIDGNTVYIVDSSYNEGIAALDAQNGNVLWQYTFVGGGYVNYSSFAVDGNGTIYVGTIVPAALHAVNPDGTLKWRYAVPGGESLGIEAAPAIDVNGNVYVEINGTGLVALDADGNYRWTAAPGGDYGWFTPTIGPDGTIYVAGDHDGQAPNQSAYAINPDGSVKWQRSADEIGAPGFFAGMAISSDGSTVYTGRGNGKVYALNAATGATQWMSQVSTWDSLSGSPALSDNGILYLTSSGGEVYAVWSGDGSLLWQYELETFSMYWGAQSPALGPDGTLYAVSSGVPPYLGGIKGRLYAFKDSGCWFMLNSMSQSFLAAGGTGSVSVTAGEAGCGWTAVSNDAFITITSESSGSGNGTVDYSVEANPSDSSRSGTMTIAGRTFRVNQAGSPPSLGNYPDTPVQAGANTAVTPDAAPTHTASINVSTTSDFRGTLAASPTTGAVMVTNAQPAGTYLVTVTAFNSLGVTTAKTFTLTVNNPMPCDTPGFSAASGSPFAAGSWPASVAVGDFNGDGKQDLAIANYSSNNVTVLLGNASGGFSAAIGSPFAVGSSPHSVAAGDFNGDGKQDLAITNSSSLSVTVLLGNGGGGFSPASGSPFAVGLHPWSVAVGDFNGDGKQDLATANVDSNNVTVLLGNGSGAFTPASGSPVGSWPQSVAVGDFNGDGKQDLATANSSSNNVTVLLGDGGGGFTPASGSPFAVGTWPLSVAAGDFNSDGKQDLASANATSNNVTVLLSDGSGGFSPASGSPFAGGSHPASVAVGDFNGDGKLDLAVANWGSNNVTVLLGNGSGGFSAASGSPFAVGSVPKSVAVGDFNGDGKQDLTTANQDSNNVTVLLNTSCTSNTAPTITAVGVIRQQGSPSANATIANVNDLEDLETALTMTVNGGASATVNGVTVSGISVSAPGVVTADVAASCTATTATFTLRVTDTGGVFNEATLTVTVNPNTAPALTYSSPQSVAIGGSLNVSPTTTGDNGAVTYSVQSGHGLTTAPTVDSSGVVSITNAQPEGAHPVTIRATDNCGAFTAAAFTLNVGAMPTLAIDDVTHNEGNAGTTSYTFTVTKTGSTALSSSVNFTTVDGTATTANNDYQANSGTLTFLPADTTKTITVLVNGDTTIEPNETFTVHLSGASNATISDADGAGTITNDDAPPLPALGNYPDTSVRAGANTTVTPDAAPTSTTNMNVSTTSNFRGAFAASPTAGVVYITNAQPAGTYTVTVTAFNSLGVTAAKTFTLTVNNPMPCDTSGFSAASGSPFATDPRPDAVAVGDFNGDGKQDLATTNDELNTVTVLLGDGSGGFSATSGSPFAVGSSPQSVAVGDFNGDGKQDLATANYFSGDVTVLLGNGSGGFSEATGSPLRFGPLPYSIAVGDFNGDRKLDLATANPGSDSVTVMLGNGSGGFSGSLLAVSGTPSFVAIGDFNGDGKPDLTTANSSSNNVTVLLGNGSGGFSTASGSPFAVAAQPLSIALGDFNGDGKLDLTTASYSEFNVTVLLGNGSGGFSAATGSPFAVGSHPWSVAVGDFNGDGKLDLTTANEGSGNVTVLMGNGGGGFSPASGSPFAIGANPCSVAVGDFNGDGKQDLATANYSSNNVTVLLNTCTASTAPTFAIDDVTHNEGNAGTTSYTFTVTKTGSTALNAGVNFNSVNGTATTANNDYQANAGSLTFLPAEATKTITVLVNGDTTVEPNETFTVHLSGASNATISDADGTGTITNDDSACSVSLTTNAASFSAAGGAGSVNVTAASGCAWAATSNASWITITSGGTGTGNGTVNYSVDPNLSDDSRTGTITIAGQTFTVNQSGIAAVGLSYYKTDFDSDGKADIGFYRLGLWGFLKSSQSYSYGSPQFFSWGGTDMYPICADFDGDGKADIGYMVPPSGGQGGAYAILKSTAGYSYGSPLFVPAGYPSLGDTPVAGDVDGDGKADPGIWRASQGVWMIPLSASNYTTFIFSQWGQLGDIPVIADFDGDGKADIGFYRDGLWAVLQSSQSYGTGSPLFFSWGGAGLQPIVGDFDGDGKTDIGYIVPPSGGQSATYAILLSSRGYSFAAGQPLFVPAGFPSLGDRPVVGDVDGDGKADPGIWRESQGVWIVPLSSSNYTTYIFSQWGQTGDIAFPNSTGRH